MATTRNALEAVSLNVEESMGMRRASRTAQLSPVSSSKDIGRKPLRTFGQVEIDRIISDPDQPRIEFDVEDIQRLSESIVSHGQMHPIRVRWDSNIDKWVIISGERRWRATKAAGLPTIDCFFVDGKLTDSELREQQLVENLLRTDLSPLEEARGYSSLMELNSWTGKKVAEALRVSPSRVSRAMALLDLPEQIQQQVEAGTLAKSSAYELSKLTNQEAQIELAAEAATNEMPLVKIVRQTKKRRGKAIGKQGVKQTFIAESGIKVCVTSATKVNYYEIEQALAEAIEDVQHRIKNGRSL